VRKIHDRYKTVTVIDGRHAGFEHKVFADSHHLDLEGAAALTDSLARVIGPRLDGTGAGDRWVELPPLRRSGRVAADREHGRVETGTVAAGRAALMEREGTAMACGRPNDRGDGRTSRRWPAGFVGALSLAVAVEVGLSMASRGVESLSAADWGRARTAASREATRADVLCVGDSLVKCGIVPDAIEARLDRPAYNLAVLGARRRPRISF